MDEPFVTKAHVSVHTTVGAKVSFSEFRVNSLKDLAIYSFGLLWFVSVCSKDLTDSQRGHRSNIVGAEAKNILAVNLKVNFV